MPAPGLLLRIEDRLRSSKTIRRLVPRQLVDYVRRRSRTSRKMGQRLEHTFLHPIGEKQPRVALGVSEEVATDHSQDYPLSVRLIKAFEYSDRNSSSGTGIWKRLEEGHHQKLVQALRDKKPQPLSKLLADMYQQEFLVGIDQNSLLTREIFSADSEGTGYLVHVKDRLVGLAEAIGCLPLENPESGRWAENIFVDTDELVETIESAMGIPIGPPDVGVGRYGLQTRRGIFNYRDVQALFTAWRIKQLLKKSTDPCICEIGGGLGKVAYYCRRLGIRNYTIIDLPQVNAFQGYYLLKSLPDEKIVLYGEDDGAGGMEGVRVYPSWAFSTIKDDTFDLVVNQDSMPEMGREVALNYLREIRKKSRDKFLSINHESEARITPIEAHPVIFKLIEEVGGYARIYRMPFWLRHGYTEELYKVLK
jgi:hypothetical protein